MRDAHEDCWQLLDEVGLPRSGAVVHCFTGGPREAEEYLQRGLYLSIPGVITFKNAQNLRDAVAQAPIDRLFIETDCPYLAPIPYRGQRNEPAYIVKTAECVGEQKGLSGDAVGKTTRDNAIRFFGLVG
ncbi:MAG: TatD family hydrolase [Myxococcota bacterium]